MKIKCLFGFHKLKKLGGPTHIGNGKFRQKMLCSDCNKIIDYEK